MVGRLNGVPGIARLAGLHFCLATIARRPKLHRYLANNPIAPAFGIGLKWGWIKNSSH